MKDQALDLAGAGARPLGLGAIPRAGVGVMMRALFLCALVALTTAASCNQETLFESNFGATAFNQPPASTQAVGTASFAGPPGSVLVAQAPPNASPPAKWLRITRPNDPAQVSSFQGKLVRQPGNGTYVFSTALFIPGGNSGPATIQFETFDQPVTSPEGFLHFDFMPDGHVRIDDDPSTTFGTFPLNQVFLVQVTLNLNDTSPNARILLSGAGASGQADRTILGPLRPRAQQFGTVRIWMGFPNVGTFHATNVVVSRKS